MKAVWAAALAASHTEDDDAARELEARIAPSRAPSSPSPAASTPRSSRCARGPRARGRGRSRSRPSRRRSPPGELDGARSVARAVGIAHETITTAELAREGYRRNDRDRCYHCKIGALRPARGARRSVVATPRCSPARTPTTSATGGRACRAAHGARRLPSAARGGMWERRRCAASRTCSRCAERREARLAVPGFPPSRTAPAVDAAVLRRIDRAELALKRLGFRVLRVRHHDRLGRVELAADELSRSTPRTRDQCWRQCSRPGTSRRRSTRDRSHPGR